MGFVSNSWLKAYKDLASAGTNALKEGPSGIATIGRVVAMPFRAAGYVASLPVRGVAKLAKISPGLTLLGGGAAAAGLAYTALSSRNSEKTIAPEMEQMQNQVVSNQQQLEMIAQAQQEQAMAAQAMAGGQIVANGNNPATRLQAGNMAQLQGLAAIPTSQMARA